MIHLASAGNDKPCTCPSGNGSLRLPCPVHPTEAPTRARATPAALIKTWRERIRVGADFPLHAPTDVERAMESEIAELRTLLALQVGEHWKKQPPTKQGDYWHWDGDEDHAPMIYHVLWSGSANKCFVSIGQYSINEAIWCNEFGGWWKKISQPSIPDGQDSAKRGAGMG